MFSKSRQMHSFTSNSTVMANLVVVEWFQTDRAVVRLDGLGRVTPVFGLTIPFGFEGRQSLEDVLFRKKLRKIDEQNISEMLGLELVNCH